MRPVLFTLAGRPFSSFRVLQWGGLLVGLLVGAQVAAHDGLDPNVVLVGEFTVLVAGVLGAHLLYAVICGARDWRHVIEHAGQRSAVLCGVAVSLAVAAPTLLVLQLPAGRFADAAAIGVLAPAVVGRIGCLLHGCCTGRPTASWYGVVLADVHGRTTRRIPTQLLDAVWALILLLAAVSAVHQLRAGATFFLVAGGYAGGRLLTEWTREGRPPFPHMTSTQPALAAVVLVAGVGLGCL